MAAYAPHVARDAFTRRSGHVDPETGVYTPRGRSRVKVRAESRQYSLREVDRVRAYRRRFPHPPGIHRGKLRVRAYYRHPGARDWLKSETQREWIAHLASYYHISPAQARRMERESRP